MEEGPALASSRFPSEVHGFSSYFPSQGWKSGFTFNEALGPSVRCLAALAP